MSVPGCHSYEWAAAPVPLAQLSQKMTSYYVCLSEHGQVTLESMPVLGVMVEQQVLIHRGVQVEECGCGEVNSLHEYRQSFAVLDEERAGVCSVHEALLFDNLEHIGVYLGDDKPNEREIELAGHNVRVRAEREGERAK